MAYTTQNNPNMEQMNPVNFQYFAPRQMDENCNESIHSNKGIRMQSSATQTVQKVDASTMTDPLQIDFRLTSEYLARCSNALGLPFVPKFDENRTAHYQMPADKVGFDAKSQNINGTTLYHCPECPYKFEKQETLQEHQADHHRQRQNQAPKDRPYQCAMCCKAFKRNEHLARHMITHSGSKSQVCGQCGKAFYRKDHLKKHVQSHSNVAARNRATPQNLVPGHNSEEAFGSLAMMMQAEPPPFFVLRT